MHACFAASRSARRFAGFKTTCATSLILAAGAIMSPCQTVTTLVTFTGANGGIPQASLTQGADGNLYGTTSNGGAGGGGTFFQLTLSGTLNTLHDFTGRGVDLADPVGRLALGSDGNFYGTTYLSGAFGLGSVFKISPAGSLTTLYSFGQPPYTDGIYPQSGVIQGTDGNLYGTTYAGGFAQLGTLFRITPGGTLTTVYKFGTVLGDGFSSVSGLTLGTDGNFYGTASEGGAYGPGTVFRITPGGVSTTIFSFTQDLGTPNGWVAAGPDGSFYGATSGGSDGMIYKVTPGGTLTKLYIFDNTHGSKPNGSLILGSDGNFYGMTSAGGTNGFGTIFRFSPAGGPLTVLYSFDSTMGANGTPYGGLIQASDGQFYGVITQNPNFANFSKGAIFRLTLPSTTVPAPTISAGGIVPVYSKVPTIQPGEWASIYGTNLASGTVSWTGNFPTSLGGTSVTVNGKSAYLWYVSPTQINFQAPADTATGTVPVVVATSGGTATSTVTLSTVAPSFSLLDSKHVTGIILRANGTGAYGGGTYDIIGPTGTSLGYPTVAAKAGDIVELFGVGFGPTSPTVLAGQVFSGTAPTTNPVTFLVNNVKVTPSFAGLSSAGLYQFNVTIPAGLGTGDVSLQAMVSGSQTQAGVVISLQ